MIDPKKSIPRVHHSQTLEIKGKEKNLECSKREMTFFGKDNLNDRFLIRYHGGNESRTFFIC